MDKLNPETTEAQLKKNENQNIHQASAIDRDWWLESTRRFPNPDARDAAIKSGELVKVEIPNIFFTSPSEIRTDVNLQLLRPEAKAFLHKVCMELDAATSFSATGIRLAVTSMYRGEEVQQDLLDGAGWYRAAAKGTSSHSAGAAFDISIRSHYQIEKDSGKMISVNSWDPKASEKYQPIVFEKLGDILSKYAEKGACNLIVENHIENEDYEPTCFHVCVSPEITRILNE